MKPAAILDVGSSKVVCLCGSMVDKDGIVVHGAGISTYAGFRDGAFLDKQSLHNAVVDCVHKILDMFAPNLVLGISDEISSTGDIERIRLVGKIVDEYNAKLEG